MPRAPTTKVIMKNHTIPIAVVAVLLFTILTLTHNLVLGFHVSQPLSIKNNYYSIARRKFQFKSLLSTKLDDDGDDAPQNCDPSKSTSVGYAMDPYSVEAKQIIQEHLGLSQEQHDKLAQLCELVVQWNENINLVSRKDCTVPVIFGRHVLPSLAPLALQGDSIAIDNDSTKNVVDVGTGGGFPGLPLAIAYPNVQFLLLDSVGKKLRVVNDMANELNLSNVCTHHGRAEEYSWDNAEQVFDVCVGRSVAAIPKFCHWTESLLSDKGGKLLYMIGGEIEPEIMDETLFDGSIENLLDQPGVSDKQVLIFSQQSVARIAAMSGEKRRQPPSKNRKLGMNNRNKTKKSKNRLAKGAWAKRDNTIPKQRGYENFQRFDSTLSN